MSRIGNHGLHLARVLLSALEDRPQ